MSSDMELHILALYDLGYRSNEIAEELNISEQAIVSILCLSSQKLEAVA